MENILLNINSLVDIKAIALYFSCEIFLLLGALLNLSLLTVQKKIYLRKISDIITAGVFSLNIIYLSLICLFSYMNFEEFNFLFLSESFKLNYGSFLIKILINSFMLLYILTNYKLIRKYSFRVPILNAILLLLALGGCLVAEAENYIMIYLLLEIISIFIYKYGSNMRLKKNSVFSSDYIILNTIATVTFIFFYVAGNSIEGTRSSIINTCISIAVLMKIGIFPVYNLLITKQNKINTPFFLLIFGYLPWIGVMTFNKLSNLINPSDEIYQIPMLIFVLVSMITFALFASKYRNINKFLANFSYYNNSICILSIIYFQANLNSICLSTMFAFSLIAIYSLVNILKLNFRIDKIYIANLQGIFLNNRFFAFIFSLSLIVMSGLIPCGITKNIVKILKNIYIYDKTGFFTVCTIAITSLIILFNCLKIVQTVYSFDRKNTIIKFTRGTVLNYAIPLVIIFFLILNVAL